MNRTPNPRNFPSSWLGLAALLIALPLVFNQPAHLLILNQMGTAVIFALSYNLLLGGTGLLSLGHAVYFGFGGFLAVHAMHFSIAGGMWLPVPLVPLTGGVMGLGIAILFGKFSTKGSGMIFAMLSLAMAELVLASSSVLGRFYGGAVDRTLLPPLFGLDFSSEMEIYGVTAAWTFAVIVAVAFFRKTPLGLLAAAVRDNPERTAFMGYNPHLVKYLTFCVSGFLAGIGGGLFAIAYEFVTVETISLTTSWQILQMVFIGGVGHFAGPVVGVVAVTLLFTVLSGYTEIWNLYVGIIFISMVLFAPNGLAGLASGLARLVKTNGLRAVAPTAFGLCVSLTLIAAGTVGLLETIFNLAKKAEMAPPLFDGALSMFALMAFWASCGLVVALGLHGCRKAWGRIAGLPLH